MFDLLDAPRRWVVFYTMDGRRHATEHQDGCGVLRRARDNQEAGNLKDNIGEHGVMEADRYETLKLADFPDARRHSCIKD